MLGAAALSLAFVGPSLVSPPRPRLAAHGGHLPALRVAAPLARHPGCQLAATGMPDSEDITCPSDGPTSMELLRFTLPTLSALLSSEVMSVIDTAVVGASSSMELAALGPAIMLTDSSAYLFFWLNVACTNLVASALARDDAEEAFKSVSDTLWCGATIGVRRDRRRCTHAPCLRTHTHRRHTAGTAAAEPPMPRTGRYTRAHALRACFTSAAPPSCGPATACDRRPATLCVAGRHERGALLLRADGARGAVPEGARDARPGDDLPADPTAHSARAHTNHGPAGAPPHPRCICCSCILTMVLQATPHCDGAHGCSLRCMCCSFRPGCM